jgi:hypothetical protein
LMLERVVAGLEVAAEACSEGRLDPDCTEAFGRVVTCCEEAKRATELPSTSAAAKLLQRARATLDARPRRLPSERFRHQSGMAAAVIQDLLRRAMALRDHWRQVGSEAAGNPVWSWIEASLQRGGPVAEDLVSRELAAILSRGVRVPNVVPGRPMVSELLRRVSLDWEASDRTGRRWSSHFKELCRTCFGARSVSGDIDLPLPSRLLPRL